MVALRGLLAGRGTARRRRAAGVLLLLALGGGAAYGQTPAAATPVDAAVTRAEYEAMRKEMAAMRSELEEFRRQRAAAATQPGAAGNAGEIAALRQEVAALRKAQTDSEKDTQEAQEELTKLVKDIQERTRANTMGDTKLLITGDAAVGFTAARGSHSTFNAGVAPRLLVQINKDIYFDSAVDIGLDRDDTGNNITSLSLTIASFNYTVNDYLVLTMGQFVVPFAAYHRYFDAPWINKLPDDPLVFSDGGLAPGSGLGFLASGAYPLTPDMKVNYAAYVFNGPELTVTSGSLGFDNNVDQNNNKGVGGRVGFLPIPEVEVGYSIMCGRASPDEFPHTNALLQALDANYVKVIPEIGGQLTLRGEWVFSHTQQATFDPAGTAGGPFNYPNNRNGGYATVAYRPTLSGIKPIRPVELVFRYDRIDVPLAAPDGRHEARYTWGIDYWLDARTVLKFAYECDDLAHAGGASAYLFQIGVGF